MNTANDWMTPQWPTYVAMQEFAGHKQANLINIPVCPVPAW